MLKLQIRFQFRILTPDDGFPNFTCLEKKAGYGHEVQEKENYRQRGYEKVWDMVLSIIGKGYSGCKSALMGCDTLISYLKAIIDSGGTN